MSKKALGILAAVVVVVVVIIIVAVIGAGGHGAPTQTAQNGQQAPAAQSVPAVTAYAAAADGFSVNLPGTPNVASKMVKSPSAGSISETDYNYVASANGRGYST